MQLKGASVFDELEMLYRNAGVALGLIDRDLRFVRVNELLAEINGVSVADHDGRTLREVLPEMADHLAEIYRPVLERGEPPIAPMLDGALVWFAGFLLITPGLVADSVGLLLLLPPLRAWCARWVTRSVFGFPDGPREEIVYPGQETTVSIRIRFQRQRKKAALEEFERGLKDYRDGGPEKYRNAIRHFHAAMVEEPEFSQAALYLARCHDALRDAERARPVFERAMERLLNARES
mgnify:CR=1 FL=1